MKKLDNRGFSLIEVIIAMAIFAIAAGGLYAMQFTSSMGNTRANQQTGAVVAASQVVEQLMKTNYDAPALALTLQADGTPVASPHDDSELAGLMIDHAPYINTITWDVSDLGEVDPDAEGTKKVDLTVTYQGGREVNITFLRIRLI
jgi:prepilin-type N-terminal cleavage/methylation domain-containing protein